MNRVKKLTLITVLATVLLICVSGGYVSAASGDKLEMLQRLGFFKTVTVADMESDAYISRGGFIDGVFSALPEEDKCALGGYIFDDVPSDGVYAQSIATAKMMGVVNGADGRCYPEINIKLDEAAAILVRLSGHGFIIDKDGGKTPESAAAELGLLSGVTSDNSMLTVNGAVNMVYNTLFVQSGITEHSGKGDKYNMESGAVVLEKIFKIYRSKGIVSDTFENGIGLYMGDDSEIVINNVKYKVDGKYAETFLSCEVRYYYRDDDNTEILYMEYKNKSDRVVIEDKNIVSFENNTYKYMQDGKRLKVFRISNACTWYYNGVAVEFPFNSFVPNTGNVVLVDNNSDGKYETAYIYDYVNIISRNAGMSTISDMYDSSLHFSIDNKDADVVIKDKDGNIVTPSTIRKFSALSVAQSANKSGKKVVCVYVSNEIITGKVDQIDLSGRCISINGIEYEYKDGGNMSGVKTGTDTTFYLNVFGNIVGCNTDYKDGFIAAYIINASISETDTLYLHVIDENNSRKYMECEEKLKIDGSTVKTAAAAISAIAANNGGECRQLILFKINSEGKINAIDLAEPYTDSLKPQNGFRNDIPPRSLLMFKNAANNFKDMSRMGETTKIFVIPTQRDDYEMYSCRNINNYNIVGDKRYTVSAYSVGTDYSYSEYAVFDFDFSNRYSYRTENTMMMAVSRSETVLDDDDEIKYRVTGYVKGALTTIDFNEENFEELMASPGDFIIYYYDFWGKPVFARKIFDESERTLNQSEIPVENYYESRYRYGNVYDNHNGRVALSEMDPGSVASKKDFAYVFSDVYPYVYRYDSKSRTLEKSDYTYIKGYTDTESDYSKLFVCSFWSDPKVIIIYD